MKCGKIIGVGNTATVYEWGEGKALKLFKKGYPKEAVEKEFFNAKAVNDLDFLKPKVYEIITFEERTGIIYDRVQGESLLDWVRKTGDIQACAMYMANLHKTILQNSVSSVSDYKEFLEYFIERSPSFEPKERKQILQILDKLQDGNTLCHGDFHPGNIFISDGQTTVIDFMNVCRGNLLYDVARTVYLVEYTPVPAEVEDKERILQFKKSLTSLYLTQMKVTREMIQDYLLVISAARKGECPEE